MNYLLDTCALLWLGMGGGDLSAEARRRISFENAFPGKTRAFLERWVDLYHGEGRDWLAHGRHIRPPRYTCRLMPYKHCFRGEGTARADMPAVFRAAYESLDGRKALVFGNATDEIQPVAYLENGVWKKLTLKPMELRLIRATPASAKIGISSDFAGGIVDSPCLIRGKCPNGSLSRDV